MPLRTCLAAAALGAAQLPSLAADLSRAEEIVKGQCAMCHGEQGESSSPVFPRLAGQHAAYLDNQLKQFNKRERNNDNAVMHSVAEKMTALEMAAVSEYLSGK